MRTNDPNDPKLKIVYEATRKINSHTEKESGVCGETMEIFYDKKIDRLDFELIEVKSKVDNKNYYKIAVNDMTDVNKPKLLFKLHISEALEIKSIFDKLAYNSLFCLNENESKK